MKLVIDTNVIVGRQFELTGPHIAILERAIALDAVELIVPEIVVQEACNKYRERVEKAHRKAEEAISALDKVLKPADKFAVPAVNIEREAKDFAKAFDARLLELRAFRPGYADIPQKVLTERDLLRRKPFQESGRGYRDALLWETILRRVVKKGEQVFVVTQDATNFWQDDKTCVLHPHLVEDLQKLDLPVDIVKLHSPLEAFIDQHLKPLLPTNKDVLKRIEHDDYAPFDFAQFFKENREEIGNEIVRGNHYQFGLPQDVDDVDIRYVEDPESAEITSANEVGNDRVFLSYDVVADVTLQFFVYKPDYYAMSAEEENFSVEDADWNDHTMLCSKTVRMPFQISLVLELSQGPKDKVESWDVEVPEFYGHCWNCGVPITHDAAETCYTCKADLIRPKRKRRPSGAGRVVRK